MERFARDISKLLFSFAFLACLVCSHASLRPASENFNDKTDIERFKNDLFLSKRDADVSNEFSAASNDEKCLQELSKIGNGLKGFEMWAMKSKFCLQISSVELLLF